MPNNKINFINGTIDETYKKYILNTVNEVCPPKENDFFQ